MKIPGFQRTSPWPLRIVAAFGILVVMFWVRFTYVTGTNAERRNQAVQKEWCQERGGSVERVGPPFYWKCFKGDVEIEPSYTKPPAFWDLW